MFTDVNGSFSNKSAIFQFSSVIYCFHVLTQQYRDRRNSKYRQQTEKYRKQVITNQILKTTTQKFYNCEREICETIVFLSTYRVLLCLVEFMEGKDRW